MFVSLLYFVYSYGFICHMDHNDINTCLYAHVYLSICQETHATGDLPTDIEQVSGAELQIGRLVVAETWVDGVHAVMAARGSQEAQEIAVTHVLHYHVQWLCVGGWWGERGRG